MVISRKVIDQAIDELSEDSIKTLAEFIAYLRFKEQQQRSQGGKMIYDLFAPMRKSIESKGMTEEEIDQVIDEAVREVR